MPFDPCQFLYYAKFMHFDALQYFSLILLKHQLFYFFTEMYMTG